MKKNQFQKKYAVTIFAILVFATSQAQIKIAAEGTPRPGYFCNCRAVNYGCISYACILNCRSKCPIKLNKIGSSESILFADIYPNSISQTNAALVLLVKPEILNRMHELEWGTMQSLNAAILEL